MKFVLASYGTRGDVEPCVAVGCELSRRSHEVRLAVAPEMVDFVEAAGLAATPFGPDLASFVESVQHAWENRRRLRDQVRLWRENRERHTRCWTAIGNTLTSLADGADLLLT